MATVSEVLRAALKVERCWAAIRTPGVWPYAQRCRKGRNGHGEMHVDLDGNERPGVFDDGSLGDTDRGY